MPIMVCFYYEGIVVSLIWYIYQPFALLILTNNPHSSWFILLVPQSIPPSNGIIMKCLYEIMHISKCLSKKKVNSSSIKWILCRPPPLCMVPIRICVIITSKIWRCNMITIDILMLFSKLISNISYLWVWKIIQLLYQLFKYLSIWTSPTMAICTWSPTVMHSSLASSMFSSWQAYPPSSWTPSHPTSVSVSTSQLPSSLWSSSAW